LYNKTDASTNLLLIENKFLECGSNKYGHDCAEHCGHCFNGTCDKVTGVCTDNKCSAGYQGDQCK
jgi:hypothetical protein